MMTTHTDYLSQSRFSSLDGLRALSVLAVIWHHTGASHYTDWRNLFGSSGMNIFFAISGFLITTLLLRERERQGFVDLKAFYIRRVLRIFPLYFGVLAIYVLIVTLLERNTPAGRDFFANLPYFISFTSNIFVHLGERVIFYFSWSVATEEQFYLVWPLVFVLCGKTERALVPLGFVLLMLMAGYLLDQPEFRLLPIAIVAGSMLAVLLHLPRTYQWLRPVLGLRLSPLLFAFLVCACLTMPDVNSAYSQLLMACLVASCSIQENHALAGFLNWAPMVYLGRISYGLYMLHMLCKNVVLKCLGFLHIAPEVSVLYLPTVALTAVVAGLSFKYYESYFMSLKKRYQR